MTTVSQSDKADSQSIDRSASSAEPESDLLATLLLWSVIVLATLAFGSLVALFADWREQLIFWQNQGGYPVLLRSIVWVTYYPLLFAFSGILYVEFLLIIKEEQLRTAILKGALWSPLPMLWLSIVLTTLS